MCADILSYAGRRETALLRIRKPVRLFQNMNLKLGDEFLRIGGLVNVHPEKFQKLVIRAVTVSVRIVQKTADPLGILLCAATVQPGQIQTFRERIRTGSTGRRIILQACSLF